ncbi:unnamed protein product [Protopolystoma xenopodis]|uniref:Uncharacterized protein n=1 Tax=Protopolystoma xenopodis TaxID=117903 RepID=A0A3S5C382_9PLAT|nr:unnamed protein product [Protopolystoma xenopodis]
MEKHHDKPFQENLPLLSSPFRNIRDFIPKGLVFSDQQDPILNNREISNFLSYSTDFSTCGDNMAQNPIQNRILQDYSDR